MDKNPDNDLKALEPTWEQFISEFNMSQINFKPTWHMPGKSPSLLDIYYADCPNQIDCVKNVSNLLSEHDGVYMQIHTSEKVKKCQFKTMRKYEKVMYDTIIDEMDKTNKI